MIKRNIEINDLTVNEIANEIANMNSEDQIKLINELGKITKGWNECGGTLDMQLAFVKNSEDELDVNGKWFISKVKGWLE